MAAALTLPALRTGKQQVKMAQARLVPLQAVTLLSQRVVKAESQHQQGVQVHYVLTQPALQRVCHHYSSQLTIPCP